MWVIARLRRRLRSWCKIVVFSAGIRVHVKPETAFTFRQNRCSRWARIRNSTGQTIDFLLTAKRHASAALRFFRKAIRHHGEPEVVTIDKSGANAAALAIHNGDKPDEAMIAIRQSKYLNNLVEQDHRNIKRRVRPMLGFKSFRRAQTILAGIELIHMIRKGQYQYPADDGMSPAEQFYLLVA